MNRLQKAHLRELLFRISVLLKGLDALVEIAGGIALWAIKPSLIVRLTAVLTQDEIIEDPNDFVASYLRHAAARLSISGEHFLAIYLLAHGAVKMFAVVALLRNKLWGYPLSLAVFGGFICVSGLSLYVDWGRGPDGADRFRSNRDLAHLARIWSCEDRCRLLQME
ncbi:MAG: DUF2127 domain-containing protein [Terriglobales bacterium]